MFDFVRDNTRLMLGLLVLLVIPSFVFFGVQGYRGFNEGENSKVAVVDGVKISQAEWDAAHRQSVDNLRRQIPNLDASLAESPELRYQSLEQLVRQRLLGVAATKQHVMISDAQLQRELLSVPQLAQLRRPDGSIDVDAYRSLLSSQGYTVEGFEASLRRDASLRRVLAGMAETGMASDAVARVALEALLQRRQISVQRFMVTDYLSKATPSDDDVLAYYKAHEADFKTVEAADIEYLVLDAATLKEGIAVSADEVRRYYEDNAAKYTRAEERRASHILVKVDPGASADAKAKAKAKAEGLLAQVRQAPAKFAEIARTQSDDAGSARNGGDLDFFSKGAMVKPFEDAAFAMKAGEIGNLVESEFGFHIIKLEAVRGGDKRSVEQVRPEIEETLRLQQAQRRYTEAAEGFSNMVYEQFDSLKAAADKFNLKIQKATVSRKPAGDAKGPLASAKLLQAVFSDDALKNKRNTDAIEVGSSQLAAARVVDYRPAAVQPLEQVKADVRERVRLEQASSLARKEGEARLAALKQDASKMDKAQSATVSRAQPAGLPRELMEAVLKADAQKLPAVFGVDLASNGYVVVRLEKILPPEMPDDQRKQWAPRLAQVWSSAEAQYYLEALKKRYKAEIKVAKPETAASELP